VGGDCWNEPAAGLETPAAEAFDAALPARHTSAAAHARIIAKMRRVAVSGLGTKLVPLVKTWNLSHYNPEQGSGTYRAI
jgi:hypothetical protein